MSELDSPGRGAAGQGTARPGEAIAIPKYLVDVRTGEALEPTPENAAELLVAARDLRNRLMGLVHDCEAVLLEESRRLGTKTMHLPAGTVTVTGGSELVWDVERLGDLVALGLPDDRWNKLVRATIVYKVNAVVAKQLEAANPEYAAIIAEARGWEEKPFRVSIR